MSCPNLRPPLRLLSLLVAALLGAALAGASPAAAQGDPMSGFFRFLFGGGQPRTQQAPPPPGAPVPLEVKPAKPRAPVEPKIVEQPKQSDAQVILVLGDSQGSNMAQGLQAAFADDPAVAVVSKARPSLAIVRDDEYDFLATLPATLAEGKFDFVVIMSGVNDRQSFYDKKTGAKTDELRSDRWETAYRNRIGAIVKILKDTGKPVYWVGQPPTERPTHSAFMGYLNGLVKPIVESAGVTFVDVWPGFTDDDGNFTYQGPDVDGKVKRLRASDGTHFTRAGQRKLAFFVEQSIRDQIKGIALAPEPVAPEAPQAPQAPQEVVLAAPPPLPPAPWKKVGPVITLGNPGADGEIELAGAPTAASLPARPGVPASPPALPALPAKADVMPGGYPLTETPQHRRLVRGEGIDPPSGRVDDFRWQRPR
ncbi:SGNH/GDSL hydrolase family protein [Prosthecomicrobium sp. N25]|uniref:SGNH/GDSL hydrolase family protein n=1 Tax=Prosthecomicrobium sp. N25 TaxID=3129254 RepID=UPI0030774D47